MKRRAGFTLIELIIVIGIVAVLAAIVIIAVNPARQLAQARNTQRRSDISAIYDALMQYGTEHMGTLPSNITERMKIIGTSGGGNYIDLNSELVPDYISSIPHDPLGSSGDTKYRAYLNNRNRLTVVAANSELGDYIGIEQPVPTAASFAAASTQTLTTTDNASLSMGDIDFTIAYWIKPSTLGTLQTPIGKYTASTSTTGEYMMRLAANDRFHFGVGSGSSFVSATATTPAVTTGQWYFVVGWHDASNDTVNIQVNNGTVYTEAHSGGVNDGFVDFTIGARTDSREYFNGALDNVAIWKRVLTAHERTSLYQAGVGRSYFSLSPDTKSDLVSWWLLDELTGTRYDAHSNNNLTDNNGVSAVSGKQ